MFLPAHLAVGFIAGRALGRWWGVPIAYLSHMILDWTAIPPERPLIYHGLPGGGWLPPDGVHVEPATWPMIAVLGLASLLMLWFGRAQWPTMLAAVLPDGLHPLVSAGWLSYSQMLAWHWAARDLLPWREAWFSVAMQAGLVLWIWKYQRSIRRAWWPWRR